MKSRLFCSVMFCLALSACATPNMATRLDLLGDPASASAATRTIAIGPDTKYVNVIGGDIVQFVVGDKSFTWNFDGNAHTAAFDLNLVAPPGVLSGKVTAYVAPNPLYLGDGGLSSEHGGGGHK